MGISLGGGESCRRRSSVDGIGGSLGEMEGVNLRATESGIK